MIRGEPARLPCVELYGESSLWGSALIRSQLQAQLYALVVDLRNFDRIDTVVVSYPVDVGLRGVKPLLDPSVGASQANVLVPGGNARSPEVEAADLVVLDGSDGRHLAVPLL